MSDLSQPQPFWRNWDRVPSWNDPRIPFVAILLTYVLVGIHFLGFNRSPAQIFLIVGTTCCFDMIFSRIFRGKWLFPLSAMITGLGLSILVNTAHGVWLPMLPAFLAVASKYLFTVNGRHVYNPNLFGLLMAVMFGGGMISPAPAYQWGGYLAISLFIVTAALILFVFKIKRNALILSFLTFYTINVLIRAYYTQWHVPMETIILGTLTSPAFYLFTFFMITDPATSPQSTRGQIGMALFISVLDLVFHKYEALSTLFKAAFIYYSLVYLYGLFIAYRKNGFSIRQFNQTMLPRITAIALVGGIGVGWYNMAHSFQSQQTTGFTFEKISAENLGIPSQPSDIMNQVDSRILHMSKWIFAQSDGVAVADVDNDGDQDFFITYSLKQAESRNSLWLNEGNWQFKRFPLPQLNSMVTNFKTEGVAATALWFDYDNDFDQDLYLVTGFGYPRLLKNLMSESGTLQFEDVSEKTEIREYTNSMTANVADFDRDGFLDLYVGNAMRTHLAGYDEPTKFSIFKLPEETFIGDERPYHFMHRTWHDANNGGENMLFMNQQGRSFKKQDAKAWGLDSTRWTLDIGIGDLNKDGFPDIYLANDFGPDELLINRDGNRFQTIKGKRVGELGRDTYKGMNATFADLNHDKHLDIYVSNVHVKLQAEGSLLWLNNGKVDTLGHRAFSDVASAKNALNENRFGWGAAAVDINLDGKLDLLQANGMVDDSYDDLYEGCPDYWYWNEKVAMTGPDVHGNVMAYADLRGRCIFPYDKKRVYINEGDYFVDIADQVNWNETDPARGIATVDFDNDGDLDVLVSHPFAPLGIYVNHQHTKRNWVGVQLIGNGKNCNSDAIGTKIELEFATHSNLPVQYREVVASNGLVAQSDRRLVFGLDNYDGAVTAHVQWCGDKKKKSYSLTSNQYQTIRQN